MPDFEKPCSVANSEFMSKKWDEIADEFALSESEMPLLELLCHWHAVVERCISDMDYGGDLPQVAYQNDAGDIKEMPQLSTMKKASAEIRAINKQLGIDS